MVCGDKRSLHVLKKTVHPKKLFQGLCYCPFIHAHGTALKILKPETKFYVLPKRLSEYRVLIFSDTYDSISEFKFRSETLCLQKRKIRTGGNVAVADFQQ